MEHIETSESLLSEIQKVKMAAIRKGILREEKPLDPITPQEIPYKLPNGWTWVRLGDYALKVTDYVASGSFASLKENVLITNEPNYAIMVKTADFANGFTKGLTYTDKHGYEFLSNSNLFGGELILSNIGSIGKVFIVPYLDQPMTLASNTVMVKVTNDELIKFLYYYFLSPLGQRTLRSISSGTSMMKFNKTQLKNTLVPVAPLSEQKYIVSLLERTAALIDHFQRQLQTLDILIKARFVEMFGDPVSNEKGWATRPLLSMGSCKNGMNFHYDNSGVEINCLGVGDFKDYSIIADAAALPTVSLNEMPSAEYLLQDDDIVFVRSNGNKKMVGRSVAVYPGAVPTTFSGFCIRYRREDDSVITPYLLRALKAESMRQKMYGRGANIQNLNQQTLSSLDIPVPPKAMQEQFAAFVSQVDKSKAVVQAALDKAQLLFNSLMQQYFG